MIKAQTIEDFCQLKFNCMPDNLKEVTGKTTSQLIAERVSQEARALLKHTNLNISGYCTDSIK